MHTAKQKNQRSDRSTSEGDDRDKCKKKLTMIFQDIWDMKEKTTMTTQEKARDLKGKGGKRLKHYIVDGDVSLCLRKTEQKSKDRSSSNKKNSEEKWKRIQHTE